MNHVEFMNKLCDVLGVTYDYFVDPRTGYLRPRFDILLGNRMVEIGIISYIEIGRRFDPPYTTITARLNKVNEKCYKEQEQLIRSIARRSVYK